MLTITSFVFAILIGALTKAAYYSIPVIGLKWNLLTRAAENGSKEGPDFWITVLLSLPMSGVAALVVVNGLELRYCFVPFIWPFVSLLPSPYVQVETMKHHLKSWKLNLLQGFGVAVSTSSAMLAAKVILNFA